MMHFVSKDMPIMIINSVSVEVLHKHTEKG